MSEAKLTYSLDEAADALGVSRRHVERLIAQDELLSVKLGRRRMVALADLQGYVERKRKQAGILATAKRRSTEEEA